MDAYEAMVARARALIPQLRERASKTEELRRLPPETERDLHDAGLFRIVQPKRAGGSELDYVALVDCADALGQADASVAWNFANLAKSPLDAGHVRPARARRGLGQGCQCADRVFLRISGRPGQEGRRGVCTERSLAVLFGRRVPANGTCWPALLYPMTMPMALSTGFSCWARMMTGSATPGK